MDNQAELPGPATIRRVTAEDWALLREARLAALTDAPYAFGSTRMAEAGFDEPEWRSRAGRLAWFAAGSDAAVIGLVGGAADLGRPAARTLFSMWTSEQARGTGLARRLVDAVTGWARADGAAELRLWTADGNDRARRFYLRAGFVPTGNRKQLPSNPAIGEDELRLLL